MPEEFIINPQYLRFGISFGTALAIAISFNQNRSVLWAIIHGFFSWLYVIYYLLFKTKK
ncbi:MAG: hypothetical protein ABFQ95_05365 [Pseudomonadota bacterium]